MPPEDPNLLRT